MRSIKSFSPFPAALLIVLTGCQQDPPVADDTMQAPVPQAAEPAAAASSHSPLPPGTSGFFPTAADAFSLIAADQQAALRDTGKAPCSVDMLNGSARADAEVVSLNHAGRFEAVGWVLNPRKEVPREFAIVLDGDAAAYALRGVAGGPRPDVARVFSAETAGSAGYRAGAALANVAPGTYRVQLAQDTYNVLTRCDTGWVVHVTE